MLNRKPPPLKENVIFVRLCSCPIRTDFSVFACLIETPLSKPLSLDHPIPPPEAMAAAPAVRFPVFGIVRLLGLAAAAGILFWAVHYRGGMALSTNEESKLPIFNVHPVLMLIGLVALNGEALLGLGSEGLESG
ncbi:probable ascorbate-specific transmembrane electron transporter 2 [Panicum hallii]|uniref:probable ascorbate-specific transmembrane electron transporter 2 n=1 Tax=Panicum hallii TaxID=206008 RepID=UPI000DF4E2CB|nr:probable ascorbate-specific transmembrane electron transporter 2 [Panicum hallii]